MNDYRGPHYDAHITENGGMYLYDKCSGRNIELTHEEWDDISRLWWECPRSTVEQRLARLEDNVCVLMRRIVAT